VQNPYDPKALLAEIERLPPEEQKARAARLREIAQRLAEADGRKLEGEQLRGAMLRAVALAQEKASR
jgi:hypothetical protein